MACSARGRVLGVECETPAGAAGVFQAGHVVAEVLKFFFGPKGARRFDHRPEYVIQGVEVAVEFETYGDIFR